MSKWRMALLATALGTGLAGAPPAQAGQTCDELPPSVVDVERGLALAHAVHQRLDASGARVVVLARAGQDLSRWGLAWSHLGYAYRTLDARGRPTWRVVHKLNACGTAGSAVYRQGLGEFFLDRPHRHEAAFVALAPALQQALWPVLTDNARLERSHVRRYSMVAYPWAGPYQQSNQWALETLAAAADDRVVLRDEAREWLRRHGYRPSVLRIDAFTRLGARVGMAHVAFDDHPGHQRYVGRIETVTVDSVFTWLQLRGMGSTPVVVR